MGRVLYMIGTSVMKELKCGVNITYKVNSISNCYLTNKFMAKNKIATTCRWFTLSINSY